jgi:hypothetical protein
MSNIELFPIDREPSNNVWAKLNSENIVENLIVAEEEFINLLDDSDMYVFVGDNDALNVHMGDFYDGVNYLSPKPFESWVLVNNVWEPPHAMPADGKMYRWDGERDDWLFVHD